MDYMELHTPCIRPGTRGENTRAYIRAMELVKPYLNYYKKQEWVFTFIL